MNAVPLAARRAAVPAVFFTAALLLAAPARAGVAASAQTGAEGAVPRISLRTQLSPTVAPLGEAPLAPGFLNSAPPLSAPPLSAPALSAPALSAPSLGDAPKLPAALIPAALQPVKPAASTPEPLGRRIAGFLFGKKTASAEAAPGDGPSHPLPAGESGDRALEGMRFDGSRPPAAPENEAERLDRAFEQTAIWAEIAPAVRAEIESLRARKVKKAALRAHVREQAAAALERIKAARGVLNVGFHFNLHGGRREDYVGAGINATMGDIALNYTTQGDRNYKVYFFQSAKHGLFAPLDERNPAIMFFPSRMGFALNLFDLDHPLLAKARADGRIKNFGAISMDFHGMRGVPYETYLAPPLEVFVATRKKLGMKVSRDEETLATVRFVEAALLRGGAFVPAAARPAAAGEP